MRKFQQHYRFARGSVVALVSGTCIAQAVAATSALHPAAPSPLQQAQPAFGATAERADSVAAPKKVDPLELKPVTGPGPTIKAAPALTPANAAAMGALTSKRNVSKSARNLFDLEDRAIIIVSGKQTTAGEIKRKLHAEIAAKAGPPKTVAGGARKLDLAALNVVAPKQVAHLRAKSYTAKAAEMPQAPVLLANQTMTQTRPSAKVAVGGMTIDKTGSYSAQKCLDKGPPVISEIRGPLKVGGQVEVWGRCFGDRAGRVEIIGQFPGGKLQAAFTAWDSGTVTIAIPGKVSGAADHTVAVSVVTAEGKVSPAMQARFIATRERVEVPNWLWSPNASFERASTVELLTPGLGMTANSTSNPAKSGQVAKSLRVNPHCALDTMDATVLVGSVGQVRGWEAGPANEAAVAIDWSATCIETTTKTSDDYLIVQTNYTVVSIQSACRVAFQVRAWAYCPVGIAP